MPKNLFEATRDIIKIVRSSSKSQSDLSFKLLNFRVKKKGDRRIFDSPVDESIVDTALDRIKTQKVDGYDLFILELMFRHNILQIITDDGDFATIPGIKVFTSNRRVNLRDRQST